MTDLEHVELAVLRTRDRLNELGGGSNAAVWKAKMREVLDMLAEELRKQARKST